VLEVQNRQAQPLSACPEEPAAERMAESLDGSMVPLVGGVWAEVKMVAIGEVERRRRRADGYEQSHLLCTSGSCRDQVLTRESGEGKLEEVDLLPEGKRRCKRHNARLRKSLNWKWCNWPNRVTSPWPRLPAISALPRVRCTGGVTGESEHGEQAFPGSGHQLPQEEEMRRLQRENDLLRQERDILKNALGIFSRSQL
jgi:hypothetical protein